MFEAAELGHAIDENQYDAEVPELREAYDAATRLGARPLASHMETLARKMRLRLGVPAAAEDAAAPAPYGLTERELEVLALMAAGRTNRQIAEEMFLAEKTVKNYVSNLLAKMEMSRRSEAAAYAARVATKHEHQYPPEEWSQ